MSPPSPSKFQRRGPEDKREAKEKQRQYRQKRWEELRADPDSLLSASDASLTHLDAKVASVHPTFPVVITSPNHIRVPFLPLSPAQVVQLRGDFRFGLEDHHHLPQMVCPGSIHNVLIRESVEHGEWRCVWSTPRHEDFSVNQAAVGIGQFSDDFLKPLLSLADELVQKANITSFSQKTEPQSIQLRSVIRSQIHLLNKIPLTRNRAFLCLRLFQRTLLELDALIAIQELLPYFNSTLSLPDQPMPISRAVIGGWTSDILIAEAMHKLGIPLWVVRTAEQLEKVIVQTIKPFPKPPSSINIAGAPIQFPHIFDGRQAESAKYRNILEFIRSNSLLSPSSVSIRASHSLVSGIPPPSISRTPASGVQRRPKNPNQKPVMKGKAEASHTDADSHLLLSRLLPSWQAAFRSTLQDETLVWSKDGSKDDAYYLPPPTIFVSSKSESNSANFFSNWIRLRLCIYVSLMTPKATPLCERPRLKYQSWRGFLFNPSEIVETGRVASSSSKPSNRDLIRQAEVGRVLQELREGDSFISLSPQSATIQWFDQPFTFKMENDTSIQMCREILWELGEMGFRMDLIALDAKLSNVDNEVDRHILLQCCFPLGKLSLLTVDLGCGQAGLSDPDWRQRGSFVFALRNVMKHWNITNLPGLINQDREDGYSAEEYEEMEASVVWCFCQNFFFVFGRMPNLPRVLNELPSSERILIPFDKPDIISTDDGKWLPLLFT